MLTVIGLVLSVVIVVAAIMAIVGLARQTFSVFCWTIAAGIGASFLVSLTQGFNWSFTDVAVDRLREGMFIAVGLLLLVCVSIAYVRFVNHRRKFKTWLGEKPTSLKRRVDRD